MTSRPLLLTRSFHSTGSRLFRRWTAECDAQLLANYKEWGPAWAFIARNQPSKRTLSECRRRWLILSGVLDREPGQRERDMWLDGFERVQTKPGESEWIKIPLEPMPASPLDRLVPLLPNHPTNWTKKSVGWSEAERLALREGYEQFVLPLKDGAANEDEVDAAWELISKRLSRRTGRQCRNFFERQFAAWQTNVKMEQLEAETEAEAAKSATSM
jgi:hypothetical protein